MPAAENNQPKISVADFAERTRADLNVEILAGRGGADERFIASERIQKIGLALAGFADYIRAGRVQIVGRSEISYLTSLGAEQRREAVKRLDLERICCVLITKNLEPPSELLEIAEEKNLPILRTELVSSEAIKIVSAFLADALAPHATVHGVLVGMYGIGVLLTGESGIGKSECALDLIKSGHQLVADDAVHVKRIGGALRGSAPALTSELLEVRGLGIVNIRTLFGVWAVAPPKRIVLCIEFKNRRGATDFERLGLETHEEEILNVKIAKFILPVSAGRNLATLVETAVRAYLLRITGGVDAARELVEKHAEQLRVSDFKFQMENRKSEVSNLKSEI
jgi:HPr kinase/phosphorylase